MKLSKPKRYYSKYIYSGISIIQGREASNGSAQDQYLLLHRTKNSRFNITEPILVPKESLSPTSTLASGINTERLYFTKGKPLQRIFWLTSLIYPLIYNKMMCTLQVQIDNTIGIMQENINKVLQRKERLDSLQNKTDDLAVLSCGFCCRANGVCKWMC